MSRTARDIAARVVERVVDEGAFSQHALRAELDRSGLVGADRALATELAYGTLTWRLAIDAALDQLLSRGLDSLPADVRSVLRVGTYQLRWRAGDVPPWAAVDEAVRAATRLRGRRFAGVVNGVLRNVQRRGEQLFAEPDGDDVVQLAARWAMPAWIVRHFIDRRGVEGADAALAAMAGRSRVHLRAADGDGDALAARLVAAGVTAAPHPQIPGAVVVEGAVARLADELEAGAAVVQDAAAQLVGLSLPADLTGGTLDACAGVGGKARHLLDRLPGVHVVATDRGAARLRPLERAAAQHADRLTVAGWDIPEPAPNEVAQHAPFSAVVVDAPCTGLGTLGRHPEVRWNREPADVAALAATQAELLDAVAALVAPGGWLLYAVCTVTRDEGPGVVEQFVAAHPEFSLVPPDSTSADPGVPWDALVDDAGRITLWPDQHGTDGFFVARLRRAP